MRFPGDYPGKAEWKPFANRSAYTLLEVLVASSAAALVIGCALVFMKFARVSVSGILSQAIVSNTSAHAIAHMRRRIQLATSTTTDAAGNTLTLGFDDNYQTDSDGDGSTYNDRDHYETFQFTGTNGTSAAAASSNCLVYTPKVGTPGSSLLVRFGVRNLPSYKIFTIPNPGTVVIRFGVVDINARDRFQSIDIQGTGVSLNRPVSSNVISILP